MATTLAPEALQKEKEKEKERSGMKLLRAADAANLVPALPAS